MKCPNCQSEQIRKNGHRRGKQNYQCKKCGRQFIEEYTKTGYSSSVKENCLKMYVNGLGFRAQGVCAQVQRLTPQSRSATLARMRRSSDASMLRIVRKSYRSLSQYCNSLG